jgi:alanyl-tRNA synthetase
MTQRLYYNDSYLSEFDACIVDRSGDGMRVYLDRSAFYPSSGGQPFDRGEIAGAPVMDVVEEGDRVAHIVAAPVLAQEVHCRIDWPRRFDHMQQHSGQHLLSAVFAEAVMLQTLSFHLGQESSTIDLDTLALDSGILRSVERRANEAIFENRPVTVQFAGPGESGDLRKPSERTGVLRIVSIEGLDRSACGGTHVRSTGEIGVRWLFT